MTNVAAGLAGSDAVNVSQLQSLANKVDSAVPLHYLSVPGGGNTSADSNYLNDGAQSVGAIAIGISAVAAPPPAGLSSSNTVAIGTSAGAAAFGGTSSLSTLIGPMAGYNAEQVNMTAIGAVAGKEMHGANNVAVGYASGIGAIGNNNIMIGGGSSISRIAAGADSVGSYNVFMGFDAGAQVNGGGNIAIGAYAGASITAKNTVALGVRASGTTDDSVALGSGSIAQAANLAAAGYNPGTGTLVAPTGAGGEVSIGSTGAERRITNVAAGLAGSDAVNVSQLQSLAATVSADAIHYVSIKDNGSTVSNYNNDGATAGNAIAIGPNALATGLDAVAMGLGSNAGADDTIAIGQGASVTSIQSLAMGIDALASGANAVAIGSNATATSMSSTAVGDAAKAVGEGATALGRAAVADNGGTAAGYGAQADIYATALGQASKAGMSAAAVGDNASATGLGSVAMGYGAKATQSYGVAVGAYTRSTADGAVALGGNYGSMGSSATVVNSVALGAGSVANVDYGVAGYDPATKAASTNTSATWTSTLAAVSVGDVANNRTRQINGVAAGSADTDAVNVAQLKNAVSGSATHYYSVKSTNTAAGSNYNNDGATGTNALAAGVGAS
ncbi:hypothetical protein ACDA63_20095, partial [Uliginosibacterium sp. sgz301328]